MCKFQRVDVNFCLFIGSSLRSPGQDDVQEAHHDDIVAVRLSRGVPKGLELNENLEIAIVVNFSIVLLECSQARGKGSMIFTQCDAIEQGATHNAESAAADLFQDLSPGVLMANYHMNMQGGRTTLEDMQASRTAVNTRPSPH